MRSVASRLYALYERGDIAFKQLLPKGLWARALLIIIVPMVVLQSVVAFVFMERHWNSVTQRLSSAVVRDIAALIEVYSTVKADQAQVRKIAQDQLGLVVDFLPTSEFPRSAQSRSSRCSTTRCRRRSAGASAARSGSTRSDARRWWRSASGSTTP